MGIGLCVRPDVFIRALMPIGVRPPIFRRVLMVGDQNSRYHTVMSVAFDSFFRFTLGFLLFIGLSFGITMGVGVVTAQQTASAQQAAALQSLLRVQKVVLFGALA